jgi:Zn-finger nucleic acid-binding protein
VNEIHFSSEVSLIKCPRCGGTDLDRGEREGTKIVGCANCFWPEPTPSEQLGEIKKAIDALFGLGAVFAAMWLGALLAGHC